jgi:hypothetical protein
MHMSSRSCFLLWLALVSGCGTRVATVSGTVNYRGEKVPSGTITFISGSTLCQAEIQNGRYEVESVPPGEAVITVVRLDPDQPDPYEALNKVRKQMLEKNVADPKQIDPHVVTDPVQLEAMWQKRHLLPFSYSSPGTTDLRFTVTPGVNTFHIDLHDHPPSK